TPLYMAPEQAALQSQHICPATDVFSIGVLMYELLTGVRPFDGENAVEIMDQVRSDRMLRLPADRRVSSELRAICETCLRRSPADRYSSAKELTEDLERYLNGQPVQATPLTRLRRIVHTARQRERIWQAGLVTVAIQIPMIVLLLILWTMMTFGLASSMPQGWQHAASPFLLVLLTIHVPSLLVGIQSLRYRWWSVPAGLFFSLNFWVPTVLVLTGILRPMSLYEGQPMAAFLVHYCFCMFAAFQTLACCAALPAALELRHSAAVR
ncbi:MAG: protein kinase, partial [Planctomycetaceae bacterium]|nr:protein kinase [Planctomycetaceae bacterium]